VLPACPTYNKWDGGGVRGAKFSRPKNIEKATVFICRIGDDLPGEAKKGARQMLGDSVRFLHELSNWILDVNTLS
jgi:hypothetical protein